ncbi:MULTISPECIES: hypothetical protein [unclassified Variovorax]|nr:MULTISPECIES: hypothetical protein [unclassified Variovorax]KWT89311.1 hypothetical protein APY03_3390 [Variovorax sp. WDL1]PNG56488.1 hypothetical protein CHC07_02905 [Variovorax sp. B4]PNG57911.1 hypothetical protein CHC06_02907 [Variovorax sp. B2]VTV09626.1 hypothetical protein WDL1CHR_00719 [Variovorax sp. WDL1]
MPDEFPCSDSEDIDFLAAAALLSIAAAVFLLWGDDIARFLNTLLLNL